MRCGHHMLGHLRTEAYREGYAPPVYPQASAVPTIESNDKAIAKGKERVAGER